MTDSEAVGTGTMSLRRRLGRLGKATSVTVG